MARKPTPLQWPDSWRRTPTNKRQRARFDTGLAVSVGGIYTSLRIMSAKHGVVTSDLPTKRNGTPYATPREPEDPGVAVWWVDMKGNERVMACDRWDTVRDNMQAVNASLNALRGLERWGASEVTERAFAGFAALPPGSGAETGVVDVKPVVHWTEVLDVKGAWVNDAPPEALLAFAKTQYRKLVSSAADGREPSKEIMIALNRAMEDAANELKCV